MDAETSPGNSSRLRGWWLLLLVPAAGALGVWFGYEPSLVTRLVAAGLTWSVSRALCSGVHRTALQASGKGAGRVAAWWMAVSVMALVGNLIWRGWSGAGLGLVRGHGILVFLWLGGSLLALLALVLCFWLGQFLWSLLSRPVNEAAAQRLAQSGGEIVALAWVLLLLAGKEVNTGLAFGPLAHLPSPWRWGFAMGLVCGFFAWWEGAGGTCGGSARLGLALGTMLSHHEWLKLRAIDVYDTRVIGSMVRTHASLNVVLPVVGLLSAGALFFLWFGRDWMWRLLPLHWTSVLVLRTAFALNPTGSVHAWIRHVGHILAHRASPFRWAYETLLALWRLILGPVPPCLRSRPLGMPSRYEQFVRWRCARFQQRLGLDLRAWRARHLMAPPARAEWKRCANSAKDLAQALVALSDYFACPHTAGTLDLSLTSALELAMATDRVVLVARALSQGPSARQLQSRQPFAALRRRACRFYDRLRSSSSESVLQEVAQFRLQVLREDPYGDRERMEWREAVERWLSQTNSADLRTFLVHAFWTELRHVADWATLIETGRVFGLLLPAKGPDRTGSPGNASPATPLYNLNPEDHLDLGEAYWFYAAELGPDLLGQWAWGQALKHFYQAGATVHLSQACPPFRAKDAYGNANKSTAEPIPESGQTVAI